MRSTDEELAATTIRDAIEADAGSIRAVGVETWPTVYGFAGADYVRDGLDRWWSLDAITASINNTRVLVAERNGAVVGTGNIDLRTSPATIWNLYVVPESQGTGVGSALIKELIALAPATEIRLEYTAGNDQVASFYETHGFQETSRSPSPLGEWAPDSVWMQRRAAS